MTSTTCSSSAALGGSHQLSEPSNMPSVTVSAKVSARSTLRACTRCRRRLGSAVTT